VIQDPKLTRYPCGMLSGKFEEDNRDLLAELITFRLVVELQGKNATSKELRERASHRKCTT
jgi:hypothetical protein